jgi:hypothetical protein
MQLRAEVATNGAGYMLVHQINVSGQARFLAQPLDAAGNPLTTEPVELATGPFINGPAAPAVVWNSSLYLVTWGSSSGVVA